MSENCQLLVFCTKPPSKRSQPTCFSVIALIYCILYIDLQKFHQNKLHKYGSLKRKYEEDIGIQILKWDTVPILT